MPLKVVQQSRYVYRKLFSWPVLKGRIRIRNDLKSSIRIQERSFRIHNTAFFEIKVKFATLNLRKTFSSVL
jgi:hypothetical protein